MGIESISINSPSRALKWNWTIEQLEVIEQLCSVSEDEYCFGLDTFREKGKDALNWCIERFGEDMPQHFNKIWGIVKITLNKENATLFKLFWL